MMTQQTLEMSEDALLLALLGPSIDTDEGRRYPKSDARHGRRRGLRAGRVRDRR